MYRIPTEPLSTWTVRLPKSILERLKAVAAARRQTVQYVVADLLDKAMRQEEA